MDVTTFVDKMDQIKWDNTYAERVWEKPDHFKIVIVGDGAVGKTCMVVRYITKEFPRDYIPTTMDISIGSIPGVDGSLSLSLWDTAGREEFDRLRPLSYIYARVVLICFSVSNEPSFERVTRVFVPEIKHHIPDVPIILVGTKSDYRNNTEIAEQLKKRNQKMVPKEKAEELAKHLKLHRYMECSALTQEGLNEVFAEAVRAASSYHIEKRKKGKCILM